MGKISVFIGDSVTDCGRFYSPAYLILILVLGVVIKTLSR